MPRPKRHRKGRGRKVYSIIVDGETEKWYFDMMKKHEDLPRIDVKPELPKKKRLEDQYDAVVENAKNYDRVIWLVDFDNIIKESKETTKGQASKIEEFRKYCERLKAYENVSVLVNTPCMEFWYLLHFETTGKYYAKCESAEKALKKSHLKDYEKTQKYYKKRNKDIYEKLKPEQSEAIKNAKQLGDFNFKNPESAKAEIFKVFDIIKE